MWTGGSWDGVAQLHVLLDDEVVQAQWFAFEVNFNELNLQDLVATIVLFDINDEESYFEGFEQFSSRLEKSMSSRTTWWQLFPSVQACDLASGANAWWNLEWVLQHVARDCLQEKMEVPEVWWSGSQSRMRDGRGWWKQLLFGRLLPRIVVEHRLRDTQYA